MRITACAMSSALLLLAPAAFAQSAMVPAPGPGAAGSGTSTQSPPSTDGRVEERVFDDPAPQQASDLQLEVQIMDRLGELGAADLSGLRVHAWRGAVLLYGVVPNQQVHDRVVISVNNLEGVRVLRDETVYGPPPGPVARGGGPRDDAAVVERVRGRVSADPGVVGQPLAVRSERGVLVLGGHVATYRDAHRVLQLARSTPGVANVRSELVVNESIVIDVPQAQR